MALSYKNDNELDERLNPANTSRTAEELRNQEQKGYDERFNDIVNNSNIADLKNAEEQSGPETSSYYRPKNEPTRQTSAVKTITKKRGIMAGVAALLLGGGAGLTLLFSPGMAIVQMKETLTKDLNDQLAAMDRRSGYVFRAKLQNLQAGGSICSGTVNIRCKFSTMSGTSVKNFEKAGIKLECGEGVSCKTGALSRNKVSSITFPDGASFTNPAEATRHARSNTQAAAAMRRAYNPLFAGFKDAPAVKAFSKLRISKQNILTSGDAEENNKRVREAVTNGVDADGSLSTAVGDDEEGKSARDRANGISEALGNGAQEVSESGVKATSGLVSGAVRTVGILGAADTACTVYRTGLAIEAGAKMVRAAQLARFAMTFLTAADSIKAGDATPEQVEFVGNIVTATDSRKQIEVPVVDSSNQTVMQKVDNPMYGKSAFDSPGYKVAAYNEAPKLSSISQQYTVGGTGGLLGALSTFNAQAANFVVNPRETCNFVQNGFVRVGSLIVGIAFGAVSGGTTIAVTAGVNIALDVALSFAEKMLIDLAAGTAVDETTTGAQAGDAIFAGSAVIMGEVAAARGLSPLTMQGVENYTVAKAETDSLNVAIDRYEAKQAPQDITNKYTFVGSLAYNLNNLAITSNGNILSSLGTLAASPLKLATANAATSTFNPERFQQCDDPTYRDLGLAPDVFCNLRYGLSDAEMSMDTMAVLDYMINNGHIDETTGEPKSDAFKNYVLYCTNRTQPIGNSGDNEPDEADGKICFDQAQQYQHFRVYLVDKSVSEGIDGEEPVAAATATSTEPTTNSGNINAEGWSYPTDTDATVSQPFIPGAHPAQDIAKNGSVPIFAVRDGVVAAAGDITTAPPYIQPCTTKTGGVQQVVTIKHVIGSETYFSAYHHVTKGSITVKPGTAVKAGDKIAMMGNTGCSFGQHLHFELWKNSIFGANGIPIDPATVLKR